MEQLGIQPVQLVTQVINFIIMAVALTFFLYKPILKVLKERREKIAEGLAYTEKTKLELEKTESKRQAVLNAAKAEAVKIINDAKKAGKEVEAEILAKAHEEALAILEKGKSDLALEKAEMEKKMTQQTVVAAQAIAEKILAEVLTTSDHHDIIGRKIKAIAKQLS